MRLIPPLDSRLVRIVPPAALPSLDAHPPHGRSSTRKCERRRRARWHRSRPARAKRWTIRLASTRARRGQLSCRTDGFARAPAGDFKDVDVFRYDGAAVSVGQVDSEVDCAGTYSHSSSACTSSLRRLQDASGDWSSVVQSSSLFSSPATSCDVLRCPVMAGLTSPSCLTSRCRGRLQVRSVCSVCVLLDLAAAFFHVDWARSCSLPSGGRFVRYVDEIRRLFTF